MAELAGKSVTIKVSGVSTAMTGEATTAAGNLTYQVTDTAKQVLDRTATIGVLLKGTNDTTEAGTNTTNIKMTAHGLATGDVIINTTRADAKRAVTYVDVDNVTVAAVTDQTNGDTIEVYKQTTGYTLNRLNGTATFAAAIARTILISGYYMPMTTAAYANAHSHSQNCSLLESSVYGATHVARLAGLLSASGTLTQINVADETFNDALTAGVPIVIEDVAVSGGSPNRFWAILDSSEMQAAIAGIQSNVVSWTSTDSMIKLGV
jgi:hypothetical protein